MKVAVISDIHGNQYALKAVMEEIHKSGIEVILVLGDLVGYYYGIQKVLGLLNSFVGDVVYIKGNHDQTLIDMIEGRVDEGIILHKYGSAHALALRSLSDQEFNFFRELYDHKTVEVGGLTFSLNHGSPSDKEQYLYPDSHVDLLQNCDDAVDFVLIGHSHYPFIFRNKRSTLVNPGSVGQSREKGGIASWCLIDTKSSTVQMKYSPYDVKDLLKEVQSNDPQNPYLREVLLR